MLCLVKRCIGDIVKKRSFVRLLSSAPSEGIKTSLYDFHIKNDGKLVNFAGYLLPVQYTDLTVSASHTHTRNDSSLFDVSHMLQTKVNGKHCLSWLESICPVDLHSMQNGSSSLTVFCNENGGILDDLIVTKVDSEHLYIVSNAGRRDHDITHMKEAVELFKKNDKDVHINFLDTSDYSLVALQGPKSQEYLQALVEENLSDLYFMNSKEMDVAGFKCRVTRCGYTGEDGFEISMPSEHSIQICETLMNKTNIKMAGLGARDSLRLEAGLCLYGNDINDTITPIEANLTWLIPKNRRVENAFMGANVIVKQIKEGVSKRRVGLRITSGPPARKGAQITSDKVVIGEVTSGCPSPTLGGNVAMGYVNEEFKKPNTELSVIIRNMQVLSQVVKMPFVPAKYYTKK